MSVSASVCVSVRVSVCCLSMWVSLFAMVRHANRARICLAEECVCVCVCEFVIVCVCLCVCVCVCLCEWVCVCVCLCKWVSVFVMMSHVDKAWICTAEELLQLYGKVEAVVGNCLLRWSGHLFEVPSTHLFDQCFCFKHITLFYAPIGAFFRLFRNA